MFVCLVCGPRRPQLSHVRNPRCHLGVLLILLLPSRGGAQDCPVGPADTIGFTLTGTFPGQPVDLRGIADSILGSWGFTVAPHDTTQGQIFTSAKFSGEDSVFRSTLKRWADPDPGVSVRATFTPQPEGTAVAFTGQIHCALAVDQGQVRKRREMLVEGWAAKLMFDYFAEAVRALNVAQ